MAIFCKKKREAGNFLAFYHKHFLILEKYF